MDGLLVASLAALGKIGGIGTIRIAESKKKACARPALLAA